MRDRYCGGARGNTIYIIELVYSEHHHVWEGEKERRRELYTRADAITEHVTSHVSVPCFPTTILTAALISTLL
jgi:hypothetical protein